jgi:hypothetical protein
MEELGHLASLLVVNALIQTNSIVVVNQEIKLSGVIDNEAVLYQIQMARLKGAGLCLRDEWEIFHEATQICHQLEITLDLAHVKSHQGANIPYAQFIAIGLTECRCRQTCRGSPQPTMTGAMDDAKGKSCTKDWRSLDNETVQESTLQSGGTPGTQRRYH